MILLQETKKEVVNSELVQTIWAGEKMEFTSVNLVGTASGLLYIWNPKVFQLKDCCCNSNFILLPVKLKALKLALKRWNMEVFGNVESKLKATDEEAHAPDLAAKERKCWHIVKEDILQFMRDFHQNAKLGSSFLEKLEQRFKRFKLHQEAKTKGSKGSSFLKKLKPRVQKVQTPSRKGLGQKKWPIDQNQWPADQTQCRPTINSADRPSPMAGGKETRPVASIHARETQGRIPVFRKGMRNIGTYPGVSEGMRNIGTCLGVSERNEKHRDVSRCFGKKEWETWGCIPVFRKRRRNIGTYPGVSKRRRNIGTYPGVSERNENRRDGHIPVFRKGKRNIGTYPGVSDGMRNIETCPGVSDRNEKHRDVSRCFGKKEKHRDISRLKLGVEAHSFFGALTKPEEFGTHIASNRSLVYCSCMTWVEPCGFKKEQIPLLLKCGEWHSTPSTERFD
ncbi:hypothetical protein HYC85_030846 [Camellia sinensis]|uniref:Uncharacterized protein n=1 Tax=Camellia sinensis TaxID=4442 RepID=A0A7J7G2Y3_CAMSI|nr:hypothetical protein HYC85_030846 [Camellia sinensis]